MPNHQWHVNKRLEKYAVLYARMATETYRVLNELPDANIQKVIEDFDTLTTTNCGWSTYQMNPIVINEANSILHWRKRAREEGANVP